jgi:tripartite ATP-independent transporter DctM subunit
MSIEMLTLVLFGSFFLLLATGFPIAWVLAAIGMIFSIIFLGPTSFSQAALCTWDQMMSFVLIAIPLFVLLGFVLQHSGLAEALYHSMLLWAGRLPGGLAIGTVFICTLIAAMVGTIGAGIVTSSIIGLPEMRKRGYDDRMVIGAIMAGGTLGVLIPPSVGFLIYSGATGLSVGRLFAAGLFPGLLLSALYMTYIGIRCSLNPAMGPPLPPEERASWGKKIISLKDSILAIILIVAVLGSIFMGIATPTEAAAVGCFLSVVISAIYRRFNLPMLRGALYDTLKIYGMILFIFAGATIFARFYMGMGVRAYLDNIVTGLTISPWFVIAGMMLFIFLAGMIIHDIAIILVAAPIFTEVVVVLGFDPLWFGMVFLVNIQIAILSPPFGPALFYMRGCVDETVGFRGVAMSAFPYMAVQAIGLTVCILYPPIILWLPNLFFGVR